MQKMKFNLQFFAGSTIDGSSTASNCDCQIVWSSTKNESANTSTVTASVQVKKSGSNSTQGTFSGTIKIDGTSYSVSKYGSWAWGKWHTIGTATKTVSHNTDGTKIIPISASLTQTGTSMAGTYQASGNATLDTIARGSVLGDIEDFSIDDTITIPITKYVETFTDNLVISCGETTIRTINAITNNAEVSFTQEEKNVIRSLMSSPKIELTFTLTTLNGTTIIGTSIKTARVSSFDKPIAFNVRKTDDGHYRWAFNGMVDETNDSPLQVYDDEGNLVGGGTNSSKNIYSTEEIKIGTWIDGKPIYRKVYQYTTGAGANSRTFSEAGITNIDKIVNISGFTLQPNSNNYVPLSYYNSSVDWANFYTGGKNAFSVRCGSSYGFGATTVIFEYTKTTD